MVKKAKKAVVRRKKTATALTELDIGLCVRFYYPRHNFHGVWSPLELRRIRIIDVRVIAAKPIEQLTVAMQPLLRRGETLVTGWDFDRRAERSFYVESMTKLQAMAEPDASELPPLYITVEENGRAIHTMKIADPRVAICRHWAKLNDNPDQVAIAVD